MDLTKATPCRRGHEYECTGELKMVNVDVLQVRSRLLKFIWTLIEASTGG
jgi:hypothetical protein